MDGQDFQAHVIDWTGDTLNAEDIHARLAAHPRLPEIVRALARNMLEAGADDRTLDGIFKDAGRYVAALWSLYLHASGGLNLPRLKAICASSGFLSPGRARALLLYMRYLGYVEPMSKRRGEPTPYVPTARFLASWRRHVRAALDCVTSVEPGVAHLAKRLDETEVFNAFVRWEGEGLLEAAKTFGVDRPFTRVFMNRHAGSQMVWVLLVADTSGIFPPHAITAPSVSAMAKRFGVSRMHIKRLFKDAENEGLIRNQPGNIIHFETRLRDDMHLIYVAQLVRLLIAAASALKECPPQTAHF